MTTQEVLILYTLSTIAVGLTATMFLTKEAMLGYACSLWWAILGGFIYPFSSTAFGDWEYFMAFGALFGMTIFCALAGFGLREKTKGLGEEEEEQEDEEDGKETPRRRMTRHEKRAERRKARS